jgi:hypothetical protein
MNLARKNMLAVMRLFLQTAQMRFGERNFGQTVPSSLKSKLLLMLSLLPARRAAICLCWGLFLGMPAVVLGQTNYYRTNGTEYAIIGSLLGDQMRPDVALSPSGGYVVWQDNVTNGSFWGISARRLDATLSGASTTFRVNAQGANDHENPRVALLNNNNGAVFAWQGGQKGFQHIYAHFLTPTNTWLTTNDMMVNSGSNTNVFYITNVTSIITTNYNKYQHRWVYTTNTTTTVTTNVSASLTSYQVSPALATLTNGNVVVVWASFNQVSSNSMLDVYGQILSPTGQKIGGEFLINQFVSYNQRTPTVAALANGGFVVCWVSEQERMSFNLGAVNNTNGSPPAVIGLPSVDIYARLYDSTGVAQSGEIPINMDSNPAANPGVAGASDGSFMVAWCARDIVNTENSWDVYARSFTNAAGGAVVRINTHLYGDQYAPRISAIGKDYLIVWTSLGQDGSREGVYGQFIHEDGSLRGGEFRVNTTAPGQQFQPAVAADGSEQFLVAWSGFSFGTNGFDLFAQRYLNMAALLPAIDAVYVWTPFAVSNGVYQPQMVVSWPALLGISISKYEVYVDGAASPVVSTNSNTWTMTAANGLTKSSTHSFQVDYVTADGRQSPLSPSVSSTTWSGANYYGIPFEWMEQYYGMNFAGWPVNASTPLVSGGPTLMQVFLSGGDPLDSSTWLKTTLTQTRQGMLLSWNTQPGFTYQVQVTTDFISWRNLPPPYDAPRFAVGTTDSIPVGGSLAGYYRILLLR